MLKKWVSNIMEQSTTLNTNVVATEIIRQFLLQTSEQRQTEKGNKTGADRTDARTEEQSY